MIGRCRNAPTHNEKQDHSSRRAVQHRARARTEKLNVGFAGAARVPAPRARSLLPALFCLFGSFVKRSLAEIERMHGAAFFFAFLMNYRRIFFIN